jgi:hypothetical protein
MGIARLHRKHTTPADEAEDARIATRGGRTPGKRTEVERGEQAEPRVAALDPGRLTLVDASPRTAGLGLDDCRVLGLRSLLGTLGEAHPLRGDLLAAAVDEDRAIAGRATAWREPLTGGGSPAGRALADATARHAVTLYRRASGDAPAEPHAPAVEAALLRSGGGDPLPAALRHEMEQALGLSLAGVRVHTDDLAARACQALAAEAFTLGEDIFFASGAFAPETRAGRKLIAHELTHVAQAAQGRAATATAGPRVSDPGELLEREADAMADQLDGAAARPAPREASPAARTASRATTLLRSPARGGQPPAVTDPRLEPQYVDNLIERVECMLIVADRYTLRWRGGHALIFNADIDWTKRSAALPVLDLAGGAAEARARATEWNDVAISTGYDRAVAFYRGEGGAILPTWFSPATTPNIHQLILAVGHKVREEARAAEDFFRQMRDGMIVGAIIGGTVRLVLRAVPLLRGRSARVAPSETPSEPVPKPTAEPIEPAAREPTAQPPSSAAAQSARAAAGNARTRAMKSYQFEAARRPAIEAKVEAAAHTAAEQAYRDATAAGKTAKQANAAANKAAWTAAEKVAAEETTRLAHLAVRDRGVFDMETMSREAVHALEEFDAGRLAPTAKRIAGELNGLSERDMLVKMATEPCTSKTVKVPGKAGQPPIDMTVYEYADGTVVRYKTSGAPERPGPIYSVEVKVNPRLPDTGPDCAAFKVDPSGNPIPRGPYHLKNPYPRGSSQAELFSREIMDAGHRELGPQNQ